ncbi:hypothetical protein BP6252_02189 [Coleophoma cylindrospora]|uniref:Uncharacterized protein n=1 Tax=Coleophoma cylindrospora TaxID=1849047 RepID=A0A3D8SE59_9HELO|nr:hypothetical protein BP6252_02189 [Coleophoma cylindrospora]
MTEWLRPKFQRTPSSFLDEVPSDVDRPDRVRASSRVSSYLGLSRPPTPSVPPSDIFGSKAPHIVYEKPSVDQMVETLKVAMMTKDSMEALHPQYNSSILHTLEAYSDMKEQLDEKGRIIEEMRQCHTKERKQFEERAASWRAKEEDYKLEMKHLEVLLANTEGGMEKVSMARTHSMLHTESRDRAITPGKRSPEALAARINLRNRRNRSKSLQRTMPPPSIPQTDRQNTPAIEIYDEQGLQLDEMEKFSGSPLQNPDNLGLGLIPVNSNASGQEHIETDLGIAFESSDSSTSASDSMGSYSRKIKEKPLPAIPFTSTTSKGTLSFLDDALHEVQLPSSPWVEVTSADQNFPSRKGFSYRPGDDSPELFSTAELPSARAKPAPASGQRRLSRSDTLQKGQRDLSSEVVKSTHVAKPRRARPQTLISTSGSQSGQSGALHSRENSFDYHVSRENSSTSSIVTAIRDNSGRSSAASAYQNPSNHPRLNRHAGGSSETAAIAAARAVASRSGSAHGDNALPKWAKNSSNRREDERKQISRHASTETYDPVNPLLVRKYRKAEGTFESRHPSLDMKELADASSQSQGPLENKEDRERRDIQRDIASKSNSYALSFLQNENEDAADLRQCLNELTAENKQANSG